MPKQYTAMKEKFIREGLSEERAKEKAARIYNSLRNKKPSMPKLSNKPGK